MTMFLIGLYYVKVLPEAFELMSESPEVATTESAPVGAEISPGAWSLQAE